MAATAGCCGPTQQLFVMGNMAVVRVECLELFQTDVKSIIQG